jgi:hypothetical protein
VHSFGCAGRCCELDRSASLSSRLVVGRWIMPSVTTAATFSWAESLAVSGNRCLRAGSFGSQLRYSARHVAALAKSVLEREPDFVLVLAVGARNDDPDTSYLSRRLGVAAPWRMFSTVVLPSKDTDSPDPAAIDFCQIAFCGGTQNGTTIFGSRFATGRGLNSSD